MTKRKNSRPPLRNDVPASVGLVTEIREELLARLESVRLDLSAQIQKVLAAVHRSQAIAEEQRSENRIVLEGLHNVIERQNRLEFETSK